MKRSLLTPLFLLVALISFSSCHIYGPGFGYGYGYRPMRVRYAHPRYVRPHYYGGYGHGQSNHGSHPRRGY